MSSNREYGARHGAAPATDTMLAMDRRERLRKLTLEQFDVTKDPYFFKNHIGKFECRLCLTLHNTESNYLAHTQGKRHQMQLLKREQTVKRQHESSATRSSHSEHRVVFKKRTVRIGRPGYRISKSEEDRVLHFEIDCPDIASATQPRVRFMSAYEQKVDRPIDPAFLYLVVAALPYETVAFKIPSEGLDKERFRTRWDEIKCVFYIDVAYVSPDVSVSAVPKP
eukprot:ANDGO_00405.mRNA.1 Splicing factor 3A subunit 2